MIDWNAIRIRVRFFGVIWKRITDPRSLGSRCIKGTDESTRKGFFGSSDAPGSVILFRIIPKDRTLRLSYLLWHRQVKAPALYIKYFYEYSAVDLQATSPLVVVSVRHVAVLLTDISKWYRPLTKRWWVYCCRQMGKELWKTIQFKAHMSTITIMTFLSERWGDTFGLQG